MSSDSRIAAGRVWVQAREDERRELDAVIASLSNSSRLARLLTYIGDKYFEEATEKLHEYDLATEVFGRSKSTFNPGEDAIVRVEAHRLRKRLKEYYEGEGKDHPIQISFPPGSYVPVFTRCNKEIDTKDRAEVEPLIRTSPKSRRWIFVASGFAILLIVGIGFLIISQHRSPRSLAVKASPPAPSLGTAEAGVFAHVPLHILAGYSGKPQLSSSGTLWLPDHYAHYGGTWTRSPGFIGRTNDPLLFEHWRNGDFSYDIPLQPGIYELHLYFLDGRSKEASPSTFSVTANGKSLLSGFDIYTDAMGADIADERIFRDITPGPDGMLHLDFTSMMGTAQLSAISILPGLPHKQLPIRIVAQPNSYTDHGGDFWRPDDYYLGGYASEKNEAVTGTSDPGLYAGERYGDFSYAIPVVPGDR